MSRPGAAGGVRLASIHIYPMKAARAVDLEESVVEPWGLAGDRRWLLVDEDGRFVSQREERSLARVVVTYGPLAETISVSAAGFPGHQVAAPAASAPPCSTAPSTVDFRPTARGTGMIKASAARWRLVSDSNEAQLGQRLI